MDADSATALVAGAFTNTYPGNGRRAGERIETEPAAFRVRVSLVKVDGEWLVDNVVDVGNYATPGTGSPVPAAPEETTTTTATAPPG